MKRVDEAMSETTIQLAYDGDALRTGSMDVRDLAPALLAIGQLCERANEVLNEDRAKVSVKVRSDFKTGSFELSLDVVQHLMDMARFLFAHKEEISTAANLLTIIGLTGGGSVSLFKLIKWLKGRRATKTTVLESGVIRIYIDNSTHVDNSVHVGTLNVDQSIHIEQKAHSTESEDASSEPPYLDVPSAVVALYNDAGVRKAVGGVIKPLEQEGVDTFEVKDGKETVEIIKKEDLPAFSAAVSSVSDDGPEPLLESERDAALVVVKPSFADDDLKWMFSDGEARFNASMLDKRFLEKLAQHQVYFTKGDVLLVKLVSTSYQTQTGIRTEHKVIKVHDIKHMPKQMPLLPEPSADSAAT